MMSEHEQINLFGEVCLVPEAKPKRRGYKTMQELHGLNNSHICKECAHLIKLQYSKAYYKCGLWKVTHSKATDIRVKQAACALFELRDGAIASYMGQ